MDDLTPAAIYTLLGNHVPETRKRTLHEHQKWSKQPDSLSQYTNCTSALGVCLCFHVDSDLIPNTGHLNQSSSIQIGSPVWDLHLYLIKNSHRAAMEQKRIHHCPASFPTFIWTPIHFQSKSEGQTEFREMTPDPLLLTHTPSCTTGYWSLSGESRKALRGSNFQCL